MTGVLAEVQTVISAGYWFKLPLFLPQSLNGITACTEGHRFSSRPSAPQTGSLTCSPRAGCPRLNDVLAALGQPLCRPPGKLHLPAGFGDGSVLVGLELGVVVRELVVKDGDGHAVEDDAEGDAGEGEDAAQVGLGEHVAVAHCGNTHLEDKRENQNIKTGWDTVPDSSCWKACESSCALSLSKRGIQSNHTWRCRTCSSL